MYSTVRTVPLYIVQTHLKPFGWIAAEVLVAVKYVNAARVLLKSFVLMVWLIWGADHQIYREKVTNREYEFDDNYIERISRRCNRRNNK